MGLVVVVSLGSFGRWCAGVSALVGPVCGGWLAMGVAGRQPSVSGSTSAARVECGIKRRCRAYPDVWSVMCVRGGENYG